MTGVDPPETPTVTATSATRVPQPFSLSDAYQQSLQRIRLLESHNTKLYEDNCQLVNAVNALNDRLSLLGAPQNVQVLRLADMQEKLRNSETNWTSINRKYHELLQSVSTGSAHHHLGMELQAIRDAYALLDREYRLLGDKYMRLTTAISVPQQQPPGLARGPNVPVARPELRVNTQDQNPGNSLSPTSVLSPGSHQPLLDQRGNHRRPSAESIMPQPPLRTGPTAMTWLAPLPTPPPTAPLHPGQIPSKGFPVHASVPAGSLPLPLHAQIVRDQRRLSGLSPVIQSKHMEQGPSERLHIVDHLRLHSGVNADAVDIGLPPRGNPAPAPPKSSPPQQKRSSSEVQTSTSPVREHKKPRIDGEACHSATVNADEYPLDKTLSPTPSANPHSDHKSPVSGSDVRSYQDCVDLIFEKDADIENGVFCGLCFDRYEAKVIQEPPDVLVQPDFDSLVTHCISMHPTAWDELRRNV